MTDSLEDKIAQEMFPAEKTPWSWRAFAADTIANVTFANVVGGSIEYFIGGLTGDQLWKVRVVSTGLTLAFGGVAGMYRKYLFNKLEITEKSSKLRKIWGDIAAVTTFWTPMSIALLYSQGATPWQVFKTIGSSRLLALPLDRPRGLWMDLWRYLFKAPSVYAQKQTYTAPAGTAPYIDKNISGTA